MRIADRKPQARRYSKGLCWACPSSLRVRRKSSEFLGGLLIPTDLPYSDRPVKSMTSQLCIDPGIEDRHRSGVNVQVRMHYMKGRYAVPLIAPPAIEFRCTLYISVLPNAVHPSWLVVCGESSKSRYLASVERYMYLLPGHHPVQGTAKLHHKAAAVGYSIPDNLTCQEAVRLKN